MEAPRCLALMNEWMCVSPYSTSSPLKPSAATASSCAPSPPVARTTATKTGTSVCFDLLTVQSPLARTSIAVIHCDIDPTMICSVIYDSLGFTVWESKYMISLMDLHTHIIWNRHDFDHVEIKSTYDGIYIWIPSLQQISNLGSGSPNIL